MIGRDLNLLDTRDNVTVAGVVMLRTLGSMATSEDEVVAATTRRFASVRSKGWFKDTHFYVRSVKAPQGPRLTLSDRSGTTNDGGVRQGERLHSGCLRLLFPTSSVRSSTAGMKSSNISPTAAWPSSTELWTCASIVRWPSRSSARTWSTTTSSCVVSSARLARRQDCSTLTSSACSTTAPTTGTSSSPWSTSPGAPLRQVLEDEGSLTPRAALDILDPTLDALAHAHRAGLIHRDVKPENVLLRDDGVVKVADFGLVRAVTSQTVTSSRPGPPRHGGLSLPEQVGRGIADARSDVYAAGLILFEMLTGEKAFSGDLPVNVAFQHVHEDVPKVSSKVAGTPRCSTRSSRPLGRVIPTCDPPMPPSSAPCSPAHARGSRTNNSTVGSAPPAGTDGSSRSAVALSAATAPLPVPSSDVATTTLPTATRSPPCRPCARHPR